MTATSDDAEFIRTLVRGDVEANRRYERRLDERGWVGFPRFLNAVFFLAVERRFGGSAESEVIKFVADLRSRATGDIANIDPGAIETMIRAVLDPATLVNLDQETMGRIQTVVIYKILTDEELSDEELDGFLSQAERLAGR